MTNTQKGPPFRLGLNCVGGPAVLAAARDAGSPREPEVTPEMREAGANEYFRQTGNRGMGPCGTEAAIYRAMHALASVELVSEGGQRALTALDFERARRGSAEERVAALEASLGEMRGERDEARQLRDAAMIAVARAREMLGQSLDSGREHRQRIAALETHNTALLATIDQLRAQLASAEALNATLLAKQPTEPPRPAHDPFRDFPTDPRRLGHV